MLREVLVDATVTCILGGGMSDGTWPPVAADSYPQEMEISILLGWGLEKAVVQNMFFLVSITGRYFCCLQVLSINKMFFLWHKL